MQATLSIQPSPSVTLGRQQNFLDMVSKILAPSNRSQLGAFVRGEALDAFRPVTVTLDPTLNCNARCAGCIERAPMSMARRRAIPWVRMQTLIPELRALGVRAVELYGGEPTYYPWFADLLRLIRDQGLHLAVVTNGSLLHQYLDVLQEVRSCLSWLRISINAGTAETHRRTFRFANPDAFRLIFETAEYLADRGLPVGFSYVVTRRNYEEIGPCAWLCEQVRSSYLELKPAVHSDSKQLLPLPARIRRAVRDQIERVYAERRDPEFQVILTDSLRLVLETEHSEDLYQPKDYSFCPSSLFRAVITPITPPGRVLSCTYHRASSKHLIGTVAHPLDEAWLHSKGRLQGLIACDPRIDCDFWCGRHALNQALWEWRRRYEAGEWDILNDLPVTDHPGACWL